MGIAGSVHHLNLEDVNSEIHSYYDQQQMRLALKRQQMIRPRCDNGNSTGSAGHWTHSLPHMINNDYAATATFERDIVESTSSLTSSLKLLPQLNERLKLRTTTNGAILYSGGTISGKREQPSSTVLVPAISKKSQPLLGLKQRSQTFIHDNMKHTSWKYMQSTQQKSEQQHAPQHNRQSLPVFRRSQTHLDLIYGNENKDDHINESSMKVSNWDTSNANTTACTASVGQNIQHHVRGEGAVQANRVKLSKYNKKRKAPAAPPFSAASAKSQLNTDNARSIATVKSNEANSRTNRFAANERMVLADKNASEDNQMQTKPRLFRSNVKVPQLKMLGKLREQLAQTQQQLLGTSEKLQTQPISRLTVKPNCYLRREKSSDAILIRHQNTLAEKSDIWMTAVKPKLVATTSTESNTNNLTHTIPEQKRLLSKIPQLSRTFYFGMSCSASPIPRTATTLTENIGKKCGLKENNEQLCQNSRLTDSAINSKRFSLDADALTAAATDAAALVVATDAVSDFKLHTSSDAKSIVDNGLFIRVHPTLPRRQPNTSSFSPVAAWRTLVEEQHRQEQQNCNGYHKTNSHGREKEDNENKSALLPYLTCGSTDEEGSSGMLQRVEKGNVKESKEAPIQLTCNISEGITNQRSNITTFSAAWTPQQDLGDDGDCDCDEGIMDDIENSTDYSNKVAVQHANNIEHNIENFEKSGCNENQEGIVGGSAVLPGVHAFSLSLPRDAHNQLNREFPHSGITSSTLPKQPSPSADSVSINASCKRNFKSSKCRCLESSKRGQQQDLPTAVDGKAALGSDCPVHRENTGGAGNAGTMNSFSDNWVLHKANNVASKSLIYCRVTANGSHRKWDADVEPISLAYLTAGKHIMYLPGKESNNISACCGDTKSTTTRHVQQHELKQQQRYQRPPRQSLEDELPARGNFTSIKSHAQLKDSVGHVASNGLEKPQKFTFQSTLRLLEKRRLAERIVKDAKLRETQRKTELEAMNRVEEDFQRKRAREKANLRHQLQLYFNGEKCRSYGILNDDINGAEALQQDHQSSGKLKKAHDENFQSSTHRDGNNNICT